VTGLPMARGGMRGDRPPASGSTTTIWPDARCFARTGAGLAVMLVGSAVPDERLAISGIPLSPLIFLICLFWLSTLPHRLATIRKCFLLQLPLVPLGISILWSTDAAFGAEKFFNLLLSVNIAVFLFLSVEQEFGSRELAKSLLVYLLGLLAATVWYKARLGLFDRYVPFLLLGPITFARLMGLGMVLGLFVLRGAARVLATLAFGLAILWTASKGPILAAALVFLAWAVSREGRRLFRWGYLIPVIAVVFGVIAAGQKLELDILQLGRLSVLWTLDIDDVARHGAANSISVRFWLAAHSLDLIAARPFGVGLGGWAMSVANNFGLEYPHNLVLELWSEAGLLFGSAALATFCAFLVAERSVWKYAALFSFLAQLVSGDLLDARFLLLFSIMSVVYGGESKKPGSGQPDGHSIRSDRSR